MKAPDLGVINRQTLVYGRQDVRATWALYKAVRDEYERHPFATFENELHKPKSDEVYGGTVLDCQCGQTISQTARNQTLS